MRRPSIFLLPLLLEWLLTTPFALTTPPLNLISPNNNNTPPLLTTTPPNHHLNLPPLSPPVCYFINDPPFTALSPLKCALLAEDLCSTLLSRGPSARHKWIRSEIGGCALGYYFPLRAAVPDPHECEELVFRKMRHECARGARCNAGAINVWTLPDYSGDGDAMDGGEGRYLMAPERLTL